MRSLSLLIETLQQAKTEGEMKNLLKGLLTLSEIEEFATRIEIVRLLKKGIGQHDIAKKLNIGVATVTRGSKEIKMGNFKYV
ncbi:MAG TPA: Trp family transcriptional regulator [Candidatus Saccharimonadales bacterium]|nr:Trp family transcriptional regulator [Candidatus Saccharimonadales bacterium]